MSTMIKVKAVFLDAAHTILELARPYPEMMKTALKRNGFDRDFEQIRDVLEAEWKRTERLFTGKNTDTKMDDKIDRDLWSGFYKRMLHSLEITDYPETIFADIYGQFTRPDNWKLYPETIETARRLNELGFRVGIGSNWDSNLPKILNYLGISEYLQMEVISCKVGYRKPAKEFFLAECEVSGLAPEEIVHVGDHPIADIEGALASGLNAVHVWRSTEETIRFSNVPQIDNLLHLCEILTLA